MITSINDSIRRLPEGFELDKVSLRGTVLTYKSQTETLLVTYNDDGREVFQVRYPTPVPAISGWQRFKNWIKELF